MTNFIELFPKELPLVFLNINKELESYSMNDFFNFIQNNKITKETFNVVEDKLYLSEFLTTRFLTFLVEHKVDKNSNIYKNNKKIIEEIYKSLNIWDSFNKIKFLDFIKEKEKESIQLKIKCNKEKNIEELRLLMKEELNNSIFNINTSFFRIASHLESFLNSDIMSLGNTYNKYYKEIEKIGDKNIFEQEYLQSDLDNKVFQEIQIIFKIIHYLALYCEKNNG